VSGRFRRLARRVPSTDGRTSLSGRAGRPTPPLRRRCAAAAGPPGRAPSEAIDKVRTAIESVSRSAAAAAATAATLPTVSARSVTAPEFPSVFSTPIWRPQLRSASVSRGQNIGSASPSVSGVLASGSRQTFSAASRSQKFCLDFDLEATVSVSVGLGARILVLVSASIEGLFSFSVVGSVDFKTNTRSPKLHRNAQFTPPASQDKTVLSVSYRAV